MTEVLWFVLFFIMEITLTHIGDKSPKRCTTELFIDILTPKKLLVVLRERVFLSVQRTACKPMNKTNSKEVNTVSLCHTL